jgi:SAM-dependent methyltransferase
MALQPPIAATGCSLLLRGPRPAPQRLRISFAAVAAAPSEKAAERGEPSYVWRSGQDRRLLMIRDACPDLAQARVLDDGCGLGTYVGKLSTLAPEVYGLDYEHERVREGVRRLGRGVLVCGAGERLPFADATFDLVLSNEVIEHVRDDREALAEMARVTRPGGRVVLFCPNRWYPVEQHGVYWRGRYHFGNVPLVNYLPDPLRDRLAPHVRAYSRRRLRRLLDALPVRVVSHTVIFGGYDNLAGRYGRLGRAVQRAMHALERTPARTFGLSHFVVLERGVSPPRVPRAGDARGGNSPLGEGGVDDPGFPGRPPRGGTPPSDQGGSSRWKSTCRS